MIEEDDVPALPIGIAIGVAVILVVIITLGFLCGLFSLVLNIPATAGLIGYSMFSGML